MAVVASAEDQVVPGTPNDYILEVTIGGASSGNTLTVALMGDSAATPTMVGGTGYVYNVAGSRLYSNASDLCSVNGPNFVWAGLVHTAPTPACNIAQFGDPVYSTGFQVGAWSVTNTMTAP
ncbi:hypothetical protein HZA44_01140 [Candidatus Peregrinibacteria bacterium]|nr:hypothetical protein [Candidatus Peregrinibacteria bacterium]